tara:strand:- start:136 stop:471 length:336 start_codon:yes stop_codon:yes gene_type:complete
MNEAKEKNIDDRSALNNEIKDTKGPLSFLSGAITSGFLAWVCFGISRQILNYFSLHTLNFSSSITQSIASGFKTLIVGISFLATFSFSFIALGLTLLFIRTLFTGASIEDD